MSTKEEEEKIDELEDEKHLAWHDEKRRADAQKAKCVECSHYDDCNSHLKARKQGKSSSKPRTLHLGISRLTPDEKRVEMLLTRDFELDDERDLEAFAKHIGICIDYWLHNDTALMRSILARCKEPSE